MMNEGIVSKNLTEELVDIFLKDCVKETGCCTCYQCWADIRAHALNHLPPRYVVTSSGDIFARVNALTTQSQADIITAIMSAIKVVTQNPRH